MAYSWPFRDQVGVHSALGLPSDCSICNVEGGLSSQALSGVTLQGEPPPSCWWLWVDDHGRAGAGIPPASFLQRALDTAGLYLLPFFFLSFPPCATVSAEEKRERVKVPVRHESVFTCKELPLNLFPSWLIFFKWQYSTIYLPLLGVKQLDQ